MECVDVKVTLQYFDGCPHWRVAEARIEALRAEGYDLVLERQLIDTPEVAEHYGFRGSPTLLVDGVDPFADLDAPIGLSCRLFRTEHGYSGAPTLDQLRAVFDEAKMG